jgi:hypothetical protein
MCPLCIGTALLLWGGTGSAGGVAAVTLRSIRKYRVASTSQTHQSQRQAAERPPCGVISETRRSNRHRLAPQERYAMILKGCRATDMTSLMKTIGSMRLENNDVPHELVFRFLFLFARYRH